MRKRHRLLNDLQLTLIDLRKSHDKHFPHSVRDIIYNKVSSRDCSLQLQIAYFDEIHNGQKTNR